MMQNSERNPDAASIDALIKALYETISGPAGQPRQWERDRALHHPRALLIPTRQLDGSGPEAQVMDFDGFEASRTPFFEKNDFYEIEIGRSEFRFGSIAQVLSAYEARKSPGGELLRRGINSLQLYFDGSRWWILSCVWDSERAENPIPKELGG